MMSPATGVPTVAAANGSPSSSLAVVLETVAHELRQPLSAIDSIAYYLNLVLPQDGGPGRAQAAQLQELVEQSNWILTCALQLADPSPLTTELLDLEKLVTQTVTARLLHDRPHTFRLELTAGLPLLRLDPGRVRNLLENLLQLFEQVSSDLYPVRLITSAEEKGVSLRITTAIPGYRSEAYLGPGCGLSLASARRIVEAHGGSFSIQVDAAAGVSVEVVLP
jgi:signal transduction histidine kinase